MPKLSRVLETALYVVDLDKAATFYADAVIGARGPRRDSTLRAKQYRLRQRPRTY
jgi:hypothetical protein